MCSLMFVEVWDVVTGNKQFTFEGHDTPVYSVCSHKKENIHVRFIFSTQNFQLIVPIFETQDI